MTVAFCETSSSRRYRLRVHRALRTVVLRAFKQAPDPCAEMHSDARAAKIGDIAHADRVALLAWSAAERLQIRLRGSARLHREDDIARTCWETLSINARKAYGRRAQPGAPTDDPDDQSNLPPTEAFPAVRGHPRGVV